MDDRYTEVLTQVLSFAGEAAIRAESGEPGFLAWRRLSERLYDAAVLADRDAITKPMCVEADERAIRQIAYTEPVTVKEMVEP